MPAMKSLVDTALRLTWSDYRWRKVPVTRPILGVREFALEGRHRLVAKVALEWDLIDDEWGPVGEARRLAWLGGEGIPVPEVVDVGAFDDGEYAILRLPPGRTASGGWPSRQRFVGCDAVADVARALHGLDAAACPFDRRLKVTIPRAQEASLFAEVRSIDPMAKLLTLIARALTVGREEPVVCHGDLRPHNVLVDAESGAVTAVTGAARMGVADRYADLVAAVRGWSDRECAGRLWYRYGEATVDADRVRLYRLLAEYC